MTNYEELKNEYLEDNEIYEIIESLEDDGYDADEAETIIEEERYFIYENCADMSDVAYYIAQERGWLEGEVGRYFDFAQFGRDLDIDGTFYQLNNNTFAEIIW
jgi:hypothetical protein